MKDSKTRTLRGLTKGNVWDLQESDIFMMWSKPDKDDAIQEHAQHYLDIISAAFYLEEIKIDKPEVIRKYEDRGMRIGIIPIKDKEQKWAIKKRPIKHVTDLTYENIHHISAAKLLEVIDSNFGGGWDSLNQGIKDIIETGFNISTTTLPKDRLHKPGGLYEIKINDGYEVLAISKGAWVEAIFAKAKPAALKPKDLLENDSNDNNIDDTDMDEDVNIVDRYYDNDDEELDDDKLTEESYRTTVEEDPDALSLDAADISDGDDDY
ncbi:MAG: hypothetical protein Q4E63_01950 [Prevotellaceae bacterium]|nr:hypothetical protein [Prevotellaceae bacterium]